jgi:hypothetical protein
MKTSRALTLLALLSSALSTHADDRFQALRQSARPLDSLGPFLERYVGSCRDEFTRADCEANVRAVRRSLDGHAYAASVAEQTLDIVRPERTARGYRFFVTPFIDGGGIALTHGKPRSQDAAGRPRIGFLVLEGALPPGMDEMSFESTLRTGRLELEIVFRPEGTWKMKRKGEPGFYEGVKAHFLGVRLVDSRSGAEIASRVF